MSWDDEDTVPGKTLRVHFDGVTVDIPGPDRVTVTDLYTRWCAEGSGENFEVRDLDGNLVAIGLRMHTARRRPITDDDDY